MGNLRSIRFSFIFFRKVQYFWIKHLGLIHFEVFFFWFVSSLSRLTFFVCLDAPFDGLFFFFIDLCSWLRGRLIEYIYIDLFLGFLLFPIVLDVHFLPIPISGLLLLYSKSQYQILLVLQICFSFSVVVMTTLCLFPFYLNIRISFYHGLQNTSTCYSLPNSKLL